MKQGPISLIGLLLPITVLAYNPEPLINAQGLAQQDLSIRGSSYTGAGISLNGINLKMPYSAHFNSEMPIYGPLLTIPQTRAGLDNAAGFPVGTSVRYISPIAPQSSMRAGVGTEERYQSTAFGSSTNMAAYLDWEKARRIDYDANDLERITGGAVVQFSGNDWNFDILGAGQTKQYGAQGYYGIPSDVQARERTDDALLIASAFRGDLDSSFMRAGVSLREFEHEYRIPSTNFASDVRSRYGSFMMEGRMLEIQDISLYARGDIEQERLHGDLGNHHRTRGSILLLPELRLERITVKGGLNSVFLRDESPEWLPQAGVDFFATDNTKLYAAYSETVQQPDYQTLYYTDPYHTGNATLRMQKSMSMEIGLHQFLSAQLDWGAAVFHRRQEHAADWTKATAGDTVWAATDLGSLNVSGIDTKVSYVISDTVRLHLFYQWITKDEYDLYAGLYELDYPEHLLALTGFWKFSPEMQLFTSQVVRYQTDNNERSGKDAGVEASLGLHYDPRFAENLRLSIRVDNMWDSDFQAIPGLRPRPATISTGITVAW